MRKTALKKEKRNIVFRKDLCYLGGDTVHGIDGMVRKTVERAGNG